MCTLIQYLVFMGNCLVESFSMTVWTPAVLSVLYAMHVFCIFVFAPVQRNGTCFTWKGALEIRSLLLLLFLSSLSTWMTSQSQCQDTLHADDFEVWCAEEQTTTTVHRTQNTINEVCSWTESWTLQFNITKTISTLFTLSTAKEKVSLKLNSQPVPQVETPMFLGGNPRHMLDMETTNWSSWSQGYQKTGHYEDTCKNHLGGQLQHPETGLHRGCKIDQSLTMPPQPGTLPQKPTKAS